MPRTWKAALAPFFAGIPERTGFIGEARFFLLNDPRSGEKKLAAHGRPLRRAGTAERREHTGGLAAAGTQSHARGDRRLAQKARAQCGQSPCRGTGARRRGPVKALAEGLLCRRGAKTPGRGLCGLDPGRPRRKGSGRRDRRRHAGPRPDRQRSARRHPGARLRAAAAISNDSGLLHVAAALGTPSIGIFGPTSPWHWAPLNPLAATIETASALPCRPCHKPVCRLVHHRCMREIAPEQVLAAVHKVPVGRGTGQRGIHRMGVGEPA